MKKMIMRWLGIEDQTPIRRSISPFGGLQSGGLVNGLTGVGTGIDKTEAFFYSPTRVANEQEFETTFAESWACRKFISIPVDDMFIRRRVFDGLEEEQSKAYNAYMDVYAVHGKLAQAMKSGRLFGSGLLVMMTNEADLATPLNVKRLRGGDLANLLVVNRYDCSVFGRNRDPWDPNYGKAETYHVNLKRGGSFTVHHSRVIRFDGQTALSDDGWTTYDEDWGVSELIPVLSSIYQEEAIARACGHLVQEASIPVQKITDFKQIVATGVDEDTGVSLETLAQNASQLKSIYRTIFMDSEDEFDRSNVTFSGLPDLFDKYAKRLAAAANIPATRFWGQSPVGMNATGESDLENYALQIAADQENKLRPVMNKLDAVLTATSGIDIGEYTFPSLMDASEQEQATVAKTRAEAIEIAVNSAVITEDEGRKALDGDAVFGQLDEIGGGIGQFTVPEPEGVGDVGMG